MPNMAPKNMAPNWWLCDFFFPHFKSEMRGPNTPTLALPEWGNRIGGNSGA
jgi:hypothetical protein